MDDNLMGISYSGTGAFNITSYYPNYGAITPGQGGYTGVSFSASRSNSVYTDSGKVYPLSVALNFIIKC